MNITGLIFCVLMLGATAAVSWVLFPLAALSPDELLAKNTPVDAELMEDVAVPDFGEVPVLDMVLHYIDNPPVESATENTKVRFQGC